MTEKPKVCDRRGKGFARPDLLKQHVAGHDDGGATSPVEGSSSTTKKRKIVSSVNALHGSRVTQACGACSASKLKCSEGKPCERCKKKKLVCEDASVDDEPEPEPEPKPSADHGYADVLPRACYTPLKTT